MALLGVHRRSVCVRTEGEPVDINDSSTVMFREIPGRSECDSDSSKVTATRFSPSEAIEGLYGTVRDECRCELRRQVNFEVARQLGQLMKNRRVHAVCFSGRVWAEFTTIKIRLLPGACQSSAIVARRVGPAWHDVFIYLLRRTVPPCFVGSVP